MDSPPFLAGCFVSCAGSVIITKGYGTQMEDTIAAIATAPGEGGIGIVRISGEKSREILEDIFTRVKKEYSTQQVVSDDASDDRSKSHFLPDTSPDVLFPERMQKSQPHSRRLPI